MTIEQAIDSAISGNSVLFTGAGFSYGAKNSLGNQIPMGDALIEEISLKIGTPRDLSLEEASEELYIKLLPEEYTKFLVQEYTACQIESYHKVIAEVPWIRIYTTNFDNVLELAYDNQGKVFKSLTRASSTKEIIESHNTIVHLNGSITNTKAETIRSDITLSEVSYLTNSIENTRWASQFRFDLEAANSVFFIGYSLFDLDIRRIIYENRTNYEKTFFILEKTPPNSLLRKIQRYGTPILSGVDGFVPLIEDGKMRYIPTTSWEYRSYSFIESKLNKGIEEINTTDIFDLLFFGNTNEKKIQTSIDTKKEYFVNRNIEEDILKEIEKNSIVCLHSFLGNGKTLLLEGIKISLLKRGYSVFSINKYKNSTFSEINEIIKYSKKPVFVFDNYPDWIRVIEYLSKTAKKDIKYVLAARTTAHDIYLESLQEYFLDRSIIEFKIDRLADTDLMQIDLLLKNNGLWGTSSSSSDEKRLSILKEDFSSQFHSILLKLLESKAIASKIERIVTEISKNQDATMLLITVFTLNYIGEPCKSNTLMDLFGSRLNEISIRNNPGIKEILDNDMNEIKVKSAIVAEYILKKHVNKSVMLEVLKKISYSCDILNEIMEYRSILKKVMRIAFLGEMLGDSNIKMIYDFYDFGRTLAYCGTNPQFWLQFAMACLQNRDYDRSGIHFETAYSYASKIPGYDLYQIDNHFAKYLLTKAIEIESYPKSYELVKLALPIITKQMMRERRKNPFNVSILVYDYWEKNKSIMKPEECKEIKLFSNNALIYISRLPSYISRNEAIQSAKVKMESIKDS